RVGLQARRQRLRAAGEGAPLAGRLPRPGLQLLTGGPGRRRRPRGGQGARALPRRPVLQALTLWRAAALPAATTGEEVEQTLEQPSRRRGRPPVCLEIGLRA